ncbi:hypothetical protein KEM56_002663 [Ascosphaera pollenicola]|nr:hypothetical protein KEM56_002663 [Ascosphaera pollenicola]
MDSMRSLNTSLPQAPAGSGNNSSLPGPEPPEELLQAFKTAALSVTTLYKNSVRGQAHARHQGYQEALEDISAFLDRECFALDAFQGAKIRHWLNERIDGSAAPTMGTGEGDENREQTEKNSTRTASTHETCQCQHHPHQQSRHQHPQHTREISPPAFTFAAGGPTFPTYSPKEHINGGNTEDLVMQLDGENTEQAPAAGAGAHASTASNLTSASVFDPSHISAPFSSSSAASTSSSTADSSAPSFNPSLRHTRNAMRQGNSFANSNSNDNNNSNNIFLGTKRKYAFGELFDISNLPGLGGNGGGMNGKDGFGHGHGGPKRGRFL